MADEKIKFSFEYYDCSGKYCLSEWDKNEIKKSLERLKDINTKSFNDLIRQRSAYHFYEIDWNKCVERGFPDKRANTLSPFHFSLVGINNQKARVFGAYQANIFYIVWFELWKSHYDSALIQGKEKLKVVLFK